MAQNVINVRRGNFLRIEQGNKVFKLTTGAPVSLIPFVEGDNIFRLNGDTEDTGPMYSTTEHAIIYYIDGVEVGRMML